MMMWAQLLPKFVGGTIEDHDAPGEPAVITGYTLNAAVVGIHTAEWSFGGSRRSLGIAAGQTPKVFELRGVGMAATVRLP